MTNGFMLGDGTYDIVIVDATADVTNHDELVVEVTILGGTHKGEVVSLRAVGLGVDEVDLLAMPGTLTVENGVPHLLVEK